MTELVISFEIEGLHYWPNAPVGYKEFGRSHRHLFKVIGWYPTKSSNDPNRREKELFELRNEAFEFLYSRDYPVRKNCIDFGPMSCEGIADLLLNSRELGFSKVFVGEEYWLGALVQ